MNHSSTLSPAKISPRLSSICERLAAQSSKIPLSRYFDLYTETHRAIPRTILDRNPPYMTQRELVIVMDAKLTFGVNRPALKGMIAKLTEDSVVEASKRAFQILSRKAGSIPIDDISLFKDAMKTLCVLRGVGPATASLVLSLISSDVPFFSDEAAVFVIKPKGGRKGLKYTAPEYWAFFKGVREECLKAGGEIKPREWERSTWANAVLEGDEDEVNVRKRPLKDAVENRSDSDSNGGDDEGSFRERKKAKKEVETDTEKDISNPSENINDFGSPEQSRRSVDSEPNLRRSRRRR
ncbi:hypothetical protein [Phaffia rhodozyma]|uniref:Uncharacterized protein n=1 Tax=Phaffia rhodozyma TaxID=264483 RepID=A0A0F7SIE1_PHARH|nr:hypothetical protein [Phaffia rhodozyma]